MAGTFSGRSGATTHGVRASRTALSDAMTFRDPRRVAADIFLED